MTCWPWGAILIFVLFDLVTGHWSGGSVIDVRVLALCLLGALPWFGFIYYHSSKLCSKLACSSIAVSEGIVVFSQNGTAISKSRLRDCQFADEARATNSFHPARQYRSADAGTFVVANRLIEGDWSTGICGFSEETRHYWVALFRLAKARSG